MRQILPGPEREAPDLLDLYDGPASYVRAGMLRSVDGPVAADGRSGPLQSPGDGDVFRALRGVCDVVLVGAGTARAEDYRQVTLSDAALDWRRRHGRTPDVPLAVVSRSLEIPDGSRWLGPHALVVTCASSPAESRERLAERAQVLVAGDDDVDLPDALRQLRERGLDRVLCEGGPRLLGDVVRAGLLDEICATTSPMLVGEGPVMVAGALPAAVPLRLEHLLLEQSTLLGRWTVTS